MMGALICVLTKCCPLVVVVVVVVVVCQRQQLKRRQLRLGVQQQWQQHNSSINRGSSNMVWFGCHSKARDRKIIFQHNK